MGPEKPYLAILGIFLGWSLQKCNTSYQNSKMQAKQIREFGSKMSYVSNLGLLFWKAIIIFDVSILKFSTKKLKFEIWKAIVIFEIRTLEFVKMKNFMQNIQIWNQKCTVSVFLRCNFESRHIWNQHLPIVKIWLSINTIRKRFVKQTFFLAAVQHTYTHWLTLYTDNNYMYEKISDGNKQ